MLCLAVAFTSRHTSLALLSCCTIITVFTRNNSVCVLCQHRVPREYHDRGPRISLTFRVIYAEPTTWYFIAVLTITGFKKQYVNFLCIYRLINLNDWNVWNVLMNLNDWNVWNVHDVNLHRDVLNTSLYCCNASLPTLLAGLATGASFKMAESQCIQNVKIITSPLWHKILSMKVSEQV